VTVRHTESERLPLVSPQVTSGRAVAPARMLQERSPSFTKAVTMRLAITVGGTDRGRSGIGIYTRAILPRLRRALGDAGGELLAIGTPNDLEAYGDVLSGAHRVVVPNLFDSPGANAMFHLLRVSHVASRAGASALLLPAANRRTVARSSLPTVAVVHDLAQLYVQRKYDPLRMAYLRYLMLPTLARAHRVVAVSKCTQNDVAGAFGWPLSRVKVVPNGVDASRFAPPTEDDMRVVAARTALGIEGPYLLYLSRLEHPGKNHLRLLNALAASRVASGHSLVLAGADWGALPLLKEEVVRQGLQNRVHFTGFLADHLIPGLLAGADAVAMVGLHEGFGLPALEALAAGRTLFVANAGALPEVTQDLAALCDPLDPRSIMAALDRALSDTTLRKRALVEGPALARRQSWDATVDALLAVCRDAISSGGHS